jgi:hypothetical protein
LNSFEATAAALGQVKYSPELVGSYVEVHLEQGPVLEALRYPLGVVKGIAGQTRLKVHYGLLLFLLTGTRPKLKYDQIALHPILRPAFAKHENYQDAILMQTI